MTVPKCNLVFDGTDDYVEIADAPQFSIVNTGELTVSAWMRPDALTFPKFEGTGYVHWIGKGEAGQQEWAFRMYQREDDGFAVAAQSHQLLCL